MLKYLWSIIWSFTKKNQVIYISISNRLQNFTVLLNILLTRFVRVDGRTYKPKEICPVKILFAKMPVWLET